MKVAVKGLLARKFRASLTAVAIVLGVAMVSGTFVLTDTISSAFDDIFVKSRTGTNVIVSGEKVVERSQSGRATVSEALLEQIRELEGVDAAAGAIEDNAKIIGSDGKAVTTFGPPTFGYGIDISRPRFNTLELVEGKWPSGQEVAIDKATSDSEGYEVGDAVGIATREPTRKFRLAGIVRFGALDSLGGATIAAFDLPIAQALFDKEDALDSISVAARSGVTDEQLVQQIHPLLPAGVDAKTAAEQAESDAEQVTQGVGLLRYFLLAFGGIALFVGAFVIFNTLSITVAQRIRELATLRTLGASGRQVVGSIMLETLLIGAVGSVVGLFAGLALAKGLSALFTAVGLDLPQTGLVLAPRTVILSLVIGIGITVVAGLAPAFRAMRVPPISAVREGATLPKSRYARYAPHAAAAVVAIALAMLGYGMFAGGLATLIRLVLLSVGCLLLFVGVALLSARIVAPLASLLGRPAKRFGGVAGRLARENSTRAPARTAASSAALMIGLALVTFVAVLGNGLRTSIVDRLREQVRAEYVVTSQNGVDPFPAAAGDTVATATQVEIASSVRGDSARIEGVARDRLVTGVDPQTILPVYRFDWVEGSDAVLAELGSNGAIVTKSFAEDREVEVGSGFEIVTPDNKKLALVVKGIYDPAPLTSVLGDATISRETFDGTFPRASNQSTFLNVRGEPSEKIERALEQKLADFPDTKVQTKSAFLEAQQQNIRLVLSLLYVLLALSVIVSLFGMINTLALAIVERTRELGMLRAIGMTRREVRRMVRHESVITALIGAALGLPLGIFLAALVTRALEDEGIVFSLPVPSLIAFAVVAIVAGILAAILPARRASRLQVLEALQYE